MESHETTSSIHAILAAFDPKHTLIRVTRPGHGIANDVIFVQTSQAEFVLKVFDDDVGSWKPQKEAALHARMRELGIPCPQVLVVNASRGVVPFMYSLSERVEGSVYSDVQASLGREANCRIYGQLGDYLGALHATTFSRFGEVQGSEGELAVGPVHELDGSSGPFARWLDMHQAIVEARLHLMRRTEFADLVPRVEAWFARHDNLIAGDITPRLLHMDLHQGNILVRDGVVSAILDLEESVVGHNEYDLMRTELANFRDQPPEYERAFMQAYGNHVAVDEGHAGRKTFYEVSRTLVWIRSLIDYGDGYVRGHAAHSSHAARVRLLTLIDTARE